MTVNPVFMQRVIVLFTLLLTQWALGQTLQQAEYFWDTDPGQGNAVPVTVLDGNFNQALESVFTNSATLPAVGNHILQVRVKGQDGSWGPTFKKFFRLSDNSDTNLEVKVTQAEYFWDVDPGLGNGTTLLAFDGNFNQALEAVFVTAAALPAVGDHVLQVRVKAQDGSWSPSFRKVFRLMANSATNVGATLTQAEYFWDDDPGVGNGFPLLSFDGNFNQALETVFQNNATLPAVGDHILNIRVKAQDGSWSPGFRKVFRLVPNNNTNLGVQITQAEYFWDNDPGIGNGFSLLAFDGNFNQALESVFTNNTTLPAQGDHVLHVRVKAQDGSWSPSFRKVFRLTPNNNTNFAVAITQAEYFWDTDPGVGNGTALLAFDGNFDEALEAVSQSLAVTVDSGLHVLQLRTKALDNQWGPVYRKVIGVNVVYNEKVVLQSPNNGATNVSVSPTLVWNQLNQIQNYQFEVSLSPAFTTLVASGFTTNATSTLIQNLATNTVYYWRVRANVNGNVSLWSDTWSFTTTNTLNLTESELLQQLVLYPVPTVKVLKVQYNLGLGDLQYEIFDALGRSILKGTLQNASIEVDRLSEGTYVISFVTASGLQYVTQFVKSGR